RVADALEGDRIIGMVMLEPGFEEDYEGNPPVHDVGGAGIIESADRLSDGRYNIVLEGISKFRILGQNTERSYRVARVEPVAESLTDEERVRLSRERSRLEEAVREAAPRVRVPSTLSDEDWVNTVVQFLPIASADRQELVEAKDALARARRLLEVLGAVRQAGR
ncbi:MAG: LON peptidase substrate-binding domain-containing protein, partial [Longimicrobiales bacterium]